MKKFAIILLLTPMALFARFSAKDALLSAPDAAIGYIGKTERLDMVDYLDAGLVERSVRNRRGVDSRLTELTDSTFVIRNGQVQTLTVRLLPARRDTLIAVIETILTPIPDSKLTLYNKAWKTLTKPWHQPSVKEWGNPSAKFLLTEYTLNGDTLTLIDHTAEWQESGAPAVKTLRYLWNRKSEKFTPLK